MKVLIGGYWDPKRAIRYQQECEELGKLLAEAGHDIIVGPGSGVVKYLLEGYTSVDQETRGKIIFYLPHPSEMIRTGEPMYDFADEIIETNQDYLERTVTMCKRSDVYMSIAGASGTIFEAVSMMFLKRPVIILEEAGAASNAAQILGGLKVYAYFAPTVEHMVKYLNENVVAAYNEHEFEEEWYNV